MCQQLKFERRRGVSKDEVIEAVKNPEDVLLDTSTGYLIVPRKKEDRYLLVVYAPKAVKRVVTVIVTSKFNIVEKRIRSGR